MTETKSIHIIRSFRKRWIFYSILNDFLMATGLAFLTGIFTNKFLGISLWWGLLILIPVFVVSVFLHASWKTTEFAIAELLNQTYPQLQESSSLLLKPHASLNTLEQLQYRKTAQVLEGIATPPGILKKRARGLLIFAAMIAGGIAVSFIPFQPKNNLPADRTVTGKRKHVEPEATLPQIKSLQVTIQPPGYMHKKTRTQDKFNLFIEEGSTVQWQLNTTLPVKAVKFIFNDSLIVALQNPDKSHSSWQMSKGFLHAGFYQLDIDGVRSELYKIETIKDLTPVIHVQTPKQYTTIDYGEPQKVFVQADMTDDYGIQDASIFVTIASGNGEAVKFKERKLAVPGFFAGKTSYRLQKQLLLQELDMHPGDELYFYIKATDNHQQETRSDIYIVNLPDTAQLMSLDGLANGVNFKPEYFRSERQIIMETEQLLKDKDTISAESFKNKSNNLGIDQKLLRLRYGKFLGEENDGETESAEQDELKDILNYSDAAKIAQAYTDKHDNAEDASYFDPVLKKQLKATLTEMWNAEIQLRTFKPQDALVFEYKALRLLKDLQQKSRAYVAKTSFKTTPLDPKKRLTGDATRIIEPAFKNDFKEDDAAPQSIRLALNVLEELKRSTYTDSFLPGVLSAANLQLNQKAVQQPTIYLPAVQALRKIMAALSRNVVIDPDDILVAENGLHQLLAVPEQLPAAQAGDSKPGLSKQYFINLQRRHQ